MLVSAAGRARPGLGALWDLPAGGPQGSGAALSSWDSGCQRERGNDGSHPQRWRNKLVGRSCSSPAPGASRHEEQHPPDACLGFCSLPMREGPSLHKLPARYPPLPPPLPHGTLLDAGEGLHLTEPLVGAAARPPTEMSAAAPAFANTGVTGERQTLPNTLRGAWLQKAVGTPALIKADRCINCWNHRSLLN